jgi:uncharacterized phage protein gp47/JayE
MTISVLSLFTAETAAKILSSGLEIAQVLGLPVSTWRNGDPTKSLYHYLAEVLAAREEKSVQFAKAGFLSTAEGEWATLQALEVYGVTRGEATYATPTVTLRNDGGGVFPDLGDGGLVVKATATGKTYRSTNNPGTLGPGGVLTFELIAEESGAASSVGTDEIDDFVSPAELATFDVVITGSTAAAAQDQQSETELKDQCGDTLGALSPNGAPDAYEYVCKNSELTGVTEINRATAIPDDDTGEVTIYVAGAAGAVTAPSIAAAQNAVLKWCTPLCIRPTVISAVELQVPITAQISGDDIPADYLAAINGALGVLFLALPIGATVYRSRLIATIHEAVPAASSVSLVAPAADVSLSPNEVPIVGTVSITEV